MSMVDDQQVFILNKAVEVSIVHGPAVFIGDHRVLAFFDFQGGGIVGQGILEKIKGIGPADNESAHVGDIEQPRLPAGI